MQICNCGTSTVRWESRLARNGERWLGTCRECGAMGALIPSSSELIIDNALTAYLADGPSRPVTPPWLRLFRFSQEEPWALVWRHHPYECRACHTNVVMTAERLLRNTHRTFLLCLNCGHTSSQEPRRPPITGGSWAPACLAVKQLRRAAFFESPFLYLPGFLRGAH
jgi:hypothetical protein